MEELVKTFKALSDPNRVKILKILELKSTCVCEFPVALGIAVSTTSQHLSILRDAGLIIDRKEGKWVYYSLNINSRNIFIRQLLALMPVWLNDDGTVKECLSKISGLNQISCCNI